MKKFLVLCAVSTLALGACSSTSEEGMYEDNSASYQAHTARVEAEQAPYKVSREIDETAAPAPTPEPAPAVEPTPVPTMDPIENQADRVFDERLSK
jgi:hypothetical protein